MYTMCSVSSDDQCQGLLCLAPNASLALNVGGKLPFSVGTPEIAHVRVSNCKPAGKLPDCRDHRYGVLPPRARSRPLYIEPDLADRSRRDWIETPRRIWREKTDAPSESVTCTVKLVFRGTVGVPEMFPELRCKPPGREPLTILI
jgi:hypothetical protein